MKTTLSNAVVVGSLSALADGELHGEEFAQTLAACERDPALLVSWRDYHLIGDVLRSPDLAVTRMSAPFLTRLQGRLAHEARHPKVLRAVDISAQPARSTAESANAPVFRWKMVAGFASMAAVVVMAWSFAVPTGSNVSQLAQSLAPTDSVWVLSPQGTILRDARLEELLTAHKQVGGNSALQMPSGFLRNATFESSSNASNARR